MANFFDQFDTAGSTANYFDQFDAPEADKEEPKRLDQSYLAGLARTALGQGTAFGLGDEIAAGARSLVGGEKYDEALKDERAKIKQFESENPVTSTVGELAGSLVTPGLGLATGALKPAATVLGKVAQGAGIGAGLGGLYGVTSSEGGDGDIIDQAGNRLSGGLKGAAFGAATGAALPAAGAAAGGLIQRARDAISPTVVKATKGIEDAADEVLANRFRRAGTTADEAATDLSNGQASTQFKGSQATLPEMIVDTSPAMNTLGGSIYRAGNEAKEIAGSALAERQGGDPAQGLFGKAKSNDDPTNQYERIVDTFKRAYGVKSKDFAKQAAAIKNEQAVLGSKSYQDAFANADKFDQPLSNVLVGWNLKARDEPGIAEQGALQKALNLFRRPDVSLASEGMRNRLDDMGTQMQSLIDKANAASAAGKDDIANGLLDKAARLDRDRGLVQKRLQESYAAIGNQPWPIDTLHRFDMAKRSLDGMIGEEKNANVKRLLVQFKNEALDAIHGGDRANPTMNVKYSDARNEWGSRAELLDALDMGRKYIGDTTGEVSAQDYAGLTNPQKAMFRLGVTKSMEGLLGGKAIGPTTDFTTVLRKPNVYQKLRDITPQGKTSSNLNDLVDRESRMSRTAAKVTGNSATAERLSADAEFGGRDLLSSAVEKFRSSPGLVNLGLDLMSTAAEHAFGFKDDMAKALAQRLFEADPQTQQAILARIQQRMGQQKTAKFLSTMSKAGLVANAGVSSQAGARVGSASTPATLSGGMGPRYDDFGNLRTSH